MPEELDISKPGKFWAIARNENTLTFHVTVSKPNYTKEALTANPQIAPADELMQPWSTSFQSADANGRVIFDLDATGRVRDLARKIEERLNRGEKLDTVKAIVIATARPGNRGKPQEADVREMKLLPLPTIDLKPILDNVTVQNFKAGTKQFKAELSVTGAVALKQVVLTTDPAVALSSSSGQSGNGTLTMPVQDGQKYTISVAVPLVMREVTEQRPTQREYIHYGRSENQDWDSPWYIQNRGWIAARTGESTERYMNATWSHEDWAGAIVTLKAAGFGMYAGISKSIQLKAVAWASDWLLKTPPPPFIHNCC